MEPSGVALVTGASRGIGRAVAVELARRGFDVVATMRDPAAGATLDAEPGTGGRIRVARLDLTDPATMAVPDDLRVLVNNGAVECEHRSFEATPMAAWRELFETNVFGLVEVTRRAVPVLRRRGGGVICNVTSSSLFAPVPFYAPYRATKAAVSAIGESLRTELAPFGIRLVEIVPGPIETDMLAGSEAPMPAADEEPYRPMAERMAAGRVHIRHLHTPAPEAARRIVDAICDDDGPLRHAPDPLADGLLQAFRTTSDEDRMRPVVHGLAGR